MAKKSDGQMLERVKAALDAGVGRVNSREGVNWINQHYGVRTTPQVFGRLRRAVQDAGGSNGTVRTVPLRTEENPHGRPTQVAASTLSEQPHSVKERLATELAGLVRDYGYVDVQEMLRIVLAVNTGSK